MESDLTQTAPHNCGQTGTQRRLQRQSQKSKFHLPWVYRNRYNTDGYYTHKKNLISTKDQTETTMQQEKISESVVGKILLPSIG